MLCDEMASISFALLLLCFLCDPAGKSAALGGDSGHSSFCFSTMNAKVKGWKGQWCPSITKKIILPLGIPKRVLEHPGVGGIQLAIHCLKPPLLVTRNSSPKRVKKDGPSWVCWPTPVFSALGRLRQEDPKSQASLGLLARFCCKTKQIPRQTQHPATAGDLFLIIKPPPTPAP